MDELDLLIQGALAAHEPSEMRSAAMRRGIEGNKRPPAQVLRDVRRGLRETKRLQKKLQTENSRIFTERFAAQSELIGRLFELYGRQMNELMTSA